MPLLLLWQHTSNRDEKELVSSFEKPVFHWSDAQPFWMKLLTIYARWHNTKLKKNKIQRAYWDVSNTVLWQQKEQPSESCSKLLQQFHLWFHRDDSKLAHWFWHSVTEHKLSHSKSIHNLHHRESKLCGHNLMPVTNTSQMTTMWRGEKKNGHKQAKLISRIIN